MRTAPFSLALPLLLSMSPVAFAQGTSAEDLFREGVSLFSRGETAAACDRFERSYKLDAAPGTLFNVANCHERQGRLWQAHLDFTDLVDRALAAGKPDKAALARTRLVAVDARLPRLSLTFSATSNAETILVDDVVLPESAWHAPLAVDAGLHAVEFRAPGFVTAKVTVVGRDPAPIRVDVPVLSRSTSAPVPVAVATTPPAAAAVPVEGATPAVIAAPSDSPVNVVRIVGYAVGGVGLVGLGVGAYFTSQAVSQHNQANAACGAKGVCPDATATSNANHFASLSTTSEIEAAVAFGIGVVGVAAGVTLIAIGHPPAPTPHATELHLAPMFASHFSGLSLTGRF